MVHPASWNHLLHVKNKVKLAMHTSLCPQLRNDTRWGSTYKMLEKYLKLCEATNHFRDCAFIIPTFQRADDEQQSEHEIIFEMVALIKEFEMISKWLQNKNNPDPKKRVTLYTVRKVFDKLCTKYSFVRRHLSVAAEIIHEPLFGSAVAKLQ